MKKLLLTIFLLISGGHCVFGQHQIPMHIIEESDTSIGGTLAPPRPWYITQDDYVLVLPVFGDDLILLLFDENNSVAYSVYIPAGTAQVILPSTLSGDFEIRLVLFGFTYYYRGYIIL